MPTDTSSDRWLLSSQLQKAIRRGKTELALYAANKLERTHPEYLRRRLRVIALEDAGIGAPASVSAYLETSAEHSAPELSDCITHLASAPKDRNGAELLRAALLHPWFEADRKYVSALPPETLAEVALNSGLSLYRRLLAAWMLAGTSRVPTILLQSTKRDFGFFVSVMQQLKLPPDIEKLCKLGTNAKDYGLGLGCAFAWLHAAPHAQEAREEPLFNDMKKGKWMLCAVDSHTRPGLAGIKRFAVECEPVRAFLQAHLGKGIKNHMRYIAALLFHQEGANAANRLTYTGWEKPFQRALEGELCKGRFDSARLEALRQLIIENITLLNDLRLQQLQ